MSIPVCKFYTLNQTCRFGKHCRYLHSVSQRPPPDIHISVNDQDEDHLSSQQSSSTLTTTDQVELSSIHHNEDSVKAPSSGRANKSSRQQNFTSEAPRRHNDSYIRERNCSNQQGFCHYFLTYGNCRYGESCKFSHQQPYNDDRSHRRGKTTNPRPNNSRAEVPPRFRNKPGQRDDPSSKLEEEHESKNLVSDQPQEDEKSRNLTRKGPPRSHGGPRKPEANKRQPKVCPYFKAGHCRWNERCRLLHHQEEPVTPGDDPVAEVQNDEVVTSSEKMLQLSLQQAENSQASASNQGKISNSNAAARSVGLKQIFSYSELEEIGLQEIRESEIRTIKRRFPQDKITIVDEESDRFSARISLSPTDPDWPFDVDTFELLFTLPAEYPKKMMSVQLPTDQDLPETVRRYVEISIGEWLNHKAEQLASREKAELVFKPFLRWFDRNLEDIITEALKQLRKELTARAAGLEFIPAQRLQEKFRAKSESSGGEVEERSGEEEDDNEEEEDSTEGSEEDSSEEDDSSDENENSPSLDLNPDKKGTEMTLRHLQLKENATALMFERVRVVLQCGRCKNHMDLSVPQGKVMSLRCEKCNHNQFVNYRAALIHQFSSTIGYLDVDGCQAFDMILQDCRVAVTCLACNKQTRINGLVTGQMIDGWCQACNARFRVATEAVKFQQLVPSGVDTSVNKVVEVTSAKSKRAPKDPAIKEGCPLPEFGTCKHYKHSYRWLRFPCCGKAYPCDVCHDKKEDHEMEIASRMICGHCCKEQNFAATRPCNACGQHLTKIRTAHWEGGSGCRDKISMSRNDVQKYKNSNKTLSNHKKKLQAGASKKKTTKLRHT